MIAPFSQFGFFGDQTGLIIAFVIGIGFGFFLERAGFSNATVLAAQFYFRDLRVLKVMFTAIVTAMVGLYLLARVGFLDLSLVYLVPTFLVPDIVGGLLLGAGFVIGGNCPGTSAVATANGRIDGLVYLLGMFAGVLAYGAAYPHLAAWTQSTAMGQITLAKLFDVSYGVLVFAVVVMGVVAFVAAEWVERKIGHREPGPGALLEPVRGFTPVRKFALVLVGLGAIALFAGNPYRGGVARVNTRQLAAETGAGADRVSVSQLADWLVTGRNDFLLVDVRPAAAYAQYHLPDAVNVPLTAFDPNLAGRGDPIILCADNEVRAAQAWFLLRSLGYRAVYLLSGGLEAWKDTVLFPVAPPADASAAEKAAFARRAAVAAHFGGAPRAAPTSTPGGAAPVPPELPKLQAPPPPPAGFVPGPARRPKREGC